MKNISALYGGAVTTNNQSFIEFYEKKKNIKKFFYHSINKADFNFFYIKVNVVEIFI